MKKCMNYMLLAILFIVCVLYANIAQTRHLAQKRNVVASETKDREAPMISQSNTSEIPALSGEMVHIPMTLKSEVKISKSDPIPRLRSNNNNNASSSSWPNPTIVVGLPKTGTTTITAYFRCGKVPRVWHWTCGNSSEVKYCGEEIRKNVQKGRPPFVGIEGANVYTQLDVLNNLPRLGNGPCYFPQVEALDAIHAAHPNSTFILPQRNLTSWINSARKWFGDRLVRCNVTGFLAGVGAKDDELANFYTDQIRRVREFIKKHPSHRLVEVKIDAPGAGEVLEEAFGIDRSCWGHENQKFSLP